MDTPQDHNALRHKTRKSHGNDEIWPADTCHDRGMDHVATKLAISLPELAAAVSGQHESMRNALYLNPEAFPPAAYLPGYRGPRFLMVDVLIWLESMKTQPASPPPAAPKPQGRPRKASAAQITRARQHEQGGAA